MGRWAVPGARVSPARGIGPARLTGSTGPDPDERGRGFRPAPRPRPAFDSNGPRRRGACGPSRPLHARTRLRPPDTTDPLDVPHHGVLEGGGGLRADPCEEVVFPGGTDGTRWRSFIAFSASTARIRVHPVTGDSSTPSRRQFSKPGWAVLPSQKSLPSTSVWNRRRSSKLRNAPVTATP